MGRSLNWISVFPCLFAVICLIDSAGCVTSRSFSFYVNTVYTPFWSRAHCPAHLCVGQWYIWTNSSAQRFHLLWKFCGDQSALLWIEQPFIPLWSRCPARNYYRMSVVWPGKTWARYRRRSGNITQGAALRNKSLREIRWLGSASAALRPFEPD